METYDGGPKAKYFRQSDGKVQCTLCPHFCMLAEGKSGICRVRKNQGGTLTLPYYGVLSSAAVDPIEKKPLYHFYPGSSIFSIGFYGCNFRCPFCQNYNISQTIVSSSHRTSPKAVVEEASRSGSLGIAYTYSEPLVHFEYILDTAKEAKKQGLKNVLVSNGYLNPEPTQELLPFLDAANIDLKAWNQEFYKTETGGNLDPVKEFLRQAFREIHLEVTTLVIPGKNDDPNEIDEAASFLASLSPYIPYHLTCYFPRYKYTVRPTTEQDLIPLIERARKHLYYVYAGNTGSGNITLCPTCGQEVIRRRGYFTRVVGAQMGKCTKCGTRIYIA
ncbi:MAG: AmmeMemoRadiSam system radical SAM enzyme [Spirochaetales bacterium]